MTLKSVHTAAKTHFLNRYRESPDFAQASQIDYRCSNRALHLAYLYDAILSVKAENASLDLSNREAIIHMLYEDAGICINDLNDIPPSLVLKILSPRFDKRDISTSPDFSEAVQNMKKWTRVNAEWIAQSHEAKLDLPELAWSDFPDDLFALTPRT